MSYIYYVQLDIPEALDAELTRIYDQEHVPMLSKVPGVRRVSRYRREQSNDSRMQKYLAIYEIESPYVVESKAWEEASAWGDWATKDPAAYDEPSSQLLPRDTEGREGPRRRRALHLRRADGHSGGNTRPSSTGSTTPSTRRCSRNAATVEPATGSKNRTTAACRNTW